MSGDFETIDPDERPEEESRSYENYRKVMADAYKKSGGMMQVRTLTNAHEEDTGPGGGISARKKFVRELVDTYGWGAIRKIDKLMQHAEDEPENMELILACIHPPELNGKGNITKQGWIDEYEDVVSRMIHEQSERVKTGTSFGDSIAYGENPFLSNDDFMSFKG